MNAPEGYELGDAYAKDKTGILYRAVQTRLDRPVTLKVLRSKYVENERARALFLEERDLVTGLEQPNILLTLDLGETDGRPWFATESTFEPRLSESLKSGEPIPELRAVNIALGLARAVHYLAMRGLVYKNVRPQNILLPRPAAPKLVTFRYVRRLEEAASFQGAKVQSGLYCAPELTRDDLGPVQSKANVYALGALLYQMLAGGPPVDGSSSEARAVHAAGEVISLKERRPYLRDRAYSVVNRLMAHKPANRADTAAAVALLEAYSNDPLVAQPLKKKRRPRGRRRR
ncbi:MAG: serine/threonine-protein kinase [Planctomycetota bacterium]